MGACTVVNYAWFSNSGTEIEELVHSAQGWQEYNDYLLNSEFDDCKNFGRIDFSHFGGALCGRTVIMPGVFMGGNKALNDAGYIFPGWEKTNYGSSIIKSPLSAGTTDLCKIEYRDRNIGWTFIPGYFSHVDSETLDEARQIEFVASTGEVFSTSYFCMKYQYSFAWWNDFDCMQQGNTFNWIEAAKNQFKPIEYLIKLAHPRLVWLSEKDGVWSADNTWGDNFLGFHAVKLSRECLIGKTPVPLPKEDDPMDCCEEVLEQIELLQLKSNKVYNILGGDRWFKGDSETPDLDIDAETAINTVRSNLYRDDSQADSDTVSAPDLISLLAAYQAVLYQRSGFHRFPAIVPENLALDPKAGDDPDLSIVDAMSWQEWLVKQIDALMGAWPIKVKYKDEEGEESTIELHNSSEALAEVYGLLLSVAGDIDIQTELGFKIITEAIAAKVAATTAVDYAKGNAEFLGYKGNLKQKKIPTAITPGADTLKKALETSEQKVPRWENEDKLDMVQLLTKILFATEVVKSAFWDTFDPERGLRGEGIKDLKEQGSAGEEESWQQFIDELRNPTGVRYSDLFPRPDINNLPQEERDGN